MNNKVRTRFGPSPTGFMHVGNLRTAIFEYLVAKANDGTFILRLEDTDRERLVEGAADSIYRTLNLVGIKYDEGPGVGGDFGPYIQSERKDIYIKYAEELVESGHAYYCFCSKERLESLKDDTGNLKYDRHCLSINGNEINARLETADPYVIRQKMPTEGSTTFNDIIYGSITIDNKEIEDQILIKSDGYPTYNFANVIDDHLMQISHVVRGNEYITSTPKYILLYEAFGWEIPVYIHLPLVIGEDGKKLSKRNGDASFEELIAQGFLPEAIVNYIALLGWSPKNEQEIFTLDEMEKIFDYNNISKSPAIFDKTKLTWVNANFIRSKSPEGYFSLIENILRAGIKNENVDLRKVAGLLQGRSEIIPDVADKIDFFDELPNYDIEIYTHKKMKTDSDNSLAALKEIIFVLDAIPEIDWNTTRIHDDMMKLVERLGVKNGQILWPLRTSVSGKQVSPGGAMEIAEILGKQETLRRVEIGIEKLSKKELI